jgi:nucleotidyltransferase/DNA polymerase involved in DNA repair
MSPPLIHPRYHWKENFVSFKNIEELGYIYFDTNASFVSVHQYLEDGQGRPAVVANGNVSQGADAGACLAISYEARSRGIQRGASLLQAKKMIPDLKVYESCLPLYDMYAKIVDHILEWIVPKEMCIRGSCDEVVLAYKLRRLPYHNFRSTLQQVGNFAQEQSGLELQMLMDPERLAHIESLSGPLQVIYGICYLIRNLLYQILGLPLSIAVAPSICLSKALIDHAKPQWLNGQRVYRTPHDAISFPFNALEANTIFRNRRLTDLCGIKTIAKRMMNVGFHTVGDVQDHCGLDLVLQITQNKHLGKVLWYSCHGRDDVLPGYLEALRSR